MTISPFVIYCDDIREDQDNQYSMIGCFKGHITVLVFPAIVPRMGILVSWTQSKDEDLLPVKVRVLFRANEHDAINDLMEGEFPIDKVDPATIQGPLISTELHMKIMMFRVEKPGTFGVRLYRGDQEYRLRGLPFLPQDHASMVES